MPHKCPLGNCSTVVGLIIGGAEPRVVEAEEKWLYTVDNFIADCGGYLGLLLGVSAVTLFELVAKTMNIQ